VTVSNGVATATKSGGHGFQNIGSSGATLGPVIQIEGATPAGLNGNWRITITSASQFTFLCPGVPNGTATGTLTAKIPPLGWEKPFSSSTEGVYRNTAGTGMFLRIQDDATFNGGKSAAVRGYENMTDLNVGDGPFPPLAVLPVAGRYIQKYNTTNEWMIIGDAKRFYFLNAYHYISSGYWTAFFGDIKSFVVGDAYHYILSADDNLHDGADAYASPFLNTGQTPGSGAYAQWAPRSWDQLPGPISYSARVPSLSTDSFCGGQTWMDAMANPADGSVIFEGPCYCVRKNESPVHIRGIFPGIHFSPWYMPAAVKPPADNRLFDNIVGLPTAVILVFSLMYGYNSTTNYVGLLDVNGPWE
jgi:hypothetical protein